MTPPKIIDILNNGLLTIWFVVNNNNKIFGLKHTHFI